MNLKKPNKNQHFINEQIPFKTVLLIHEDNSSEELSLDEAIQIARKTEEDLILINDKAPVPVVKIHEYGKYLYSLKRKNKGANKNVSKVKSITVKPKIDTHDISWKANQAIEWFKMGDRVQFIVRATGRMSARTDLIQFVYEKFCSLVEAYGVPKAPLKQCSRIQYETYFFPVKGVASNN